MTRALLFVAGLAATAYGGWLLWDRGPEDVQAAVTWLVVGVLAHDAVLAPATIVLGLLAGVVVPAGWRGPVVAAYVVLGSLTLVAFPVLGRFGARADNPTLLDRDYVTGWLVAATLTVIGALLLGLLQRFRTRERE